MTTTDPANETEPAAGLRRVDLLSPWPAGMRAMAAFDRSVREATTLEPSLVHLVKQRASQLNGCAYCLDLHAKEARADGESQQRLDVLQAWHEVPLFTDRERAALALTEAITLVGETHVPDEVVDEARRHFDPAELSQVVFYAVVINAWNRISITSRTPLPPPEG